MKKVLILTLCALLGLQAGSNLSKVSLSFSNTNSHVLHPIPYEAQKVSRPLVITIPKLGIDTAIESVAHDTVGNMDIPKDIDNVAWYSPGAKPGEQGNAVIAGHYDSDTGPALFYSLDTLEPGDEIIITDEQGKSHRFEVESKGVYPYDQFPIEEVFGAHDEARLNLISCEGSFDEKSKRYSHRTVVFAELKRGFLYF